MRFLGASARGRGRAYLVGGASAAILGWRDSTLDIDIKLDPEPAGAFDAIARAKEALNINVELAAPDDFLPPLPDWRERSVFIDRHGPVDFFHYDFYAQALAKIHRGHRQDLDDVEAMHRLQLIECQALMRLFEAIEPGLGIYPSVDGAQFRTRVRAMIRTLSAPGPKNG